MKTVQPPFDADDLHRIDEAERQPTANELANRYVVDPDDDVREWVNSRPTDFDRE
ncbi:MAG: hypothetical protein KC680_02580 [Candidatus Peregrinibacteria bacterium]|nr:hypothetical protein [Candidatus Peregrinibacteria bacterium]MCB9808736.1 hypothetical protein [Candidatus Peribacteria bacterium]